MKSIRETAALVLGLVVGLAIVAQCDGCASFPSSRKELEAETKYGASQYKECVEPEPILSPAATREQRLAAWARVDACRARVQARWFGDAGIVETVSDGGGQ